ncbi:MAG TPA: histidine phosphatase family protein [Solirubrobacteraceae bacterium]|nr:histidine phosphatase family protein [Solirubrobacteraceae bacterium]
MSGAAQDALGGVLLARHGQTDDNLEPLRFQGFRDTPLNDTGRAQARELSLKVAARPDPIKSLWSSDLSRASETAEIVGAAIGLEPRLDSRLREANRGRWESYTFDEIKRSEPEEYAAWMRGGAGWRFPGGESLQEQQDRVLAALSDIEAAGELPALAVCHGGSIRVVLCSRDPRGLDAFHDFEVPNVAVVPL